MHRSPPSDADSFHPPPAEIKELAMSKIEVDIDKLPPEIEGVVGWEYYSNGNTKQGDYYWDIDWNQWSKATGCHNWDLCARPIYAPKKVKVKAWLMRYDKLYMLKFELPIRFANSNSWHDEYKASEDIAKANPLQPGECKIVEVEVEAVAPRIEE